MLLLTMFCRCLLAIIYPPPLPLASPSLFFTSTSYCLSAALLTETLSALMLMGCLGPVVWCGQGRRSTAHAT